ncbi:MAG: YifB family Mg chelatase-like AAA ATPase [Granulosicoccus sp.]
MAFATVLSCTLSGVSALPVVVEVHTSGGLPGMSLVGLPQSTVRESKDRVRAAIENNNFKWPQQKIIVNLAPADLPKHGGRFDLPIALGILLATDQLPTGSLEKLVVLGELGLDGEVRSVSGVLPTSYAYSATQQALLIPRANAAEALRSKDTCVHAASCLSTICEHLKVRSRQPLHRLCMDDVDMQTEGEDASGCSGQRCDMRDVFGQHKARRALEIAAAGSHNLLMVGPPGTGKSMLASRLASIQPDMSEAESMQAASIASISHTGFNARTWGLRPFRSPHHTASGVALVGGGSNPMPGEISLAHNGVLFLDELPEFSRVVLDVLREPMETGEITVSRAARQATFPSRFQLVAAMNPCPCGYHDDSKTACRCAAEQILRYQSRVSGPFLDRIDLHLQLQRETHSDGALQSTHNNEDSQSIRTRVVESRERQLARQGNVNAHLDAAALRQYARLSNDAQTLFAKASNAMSLSLRAQHRLLRVARTIADMEGSSAVSKVHIAECLAYRRAPVLH